MLRRNRLTASELAARIADALMELTPAGMEVVPRLIPITAQRRSETTPHGGGGGGLWCRPKGGPEAANQDGHRGHPPPLKLVRDWLKTGATCLVTHSAARVAIPHSPHSSNLPRGAPRVRRYLLTALMTDPSAPDVPRR